MKRTVLLLSVTALLFSFQNIHSQSLRDRVKKVVFKEPVEVKDDSTTVVEIEDAGESSSVKFSDKIMMDALGLTGNVAYETVYSFDAYIQMEITNYKKNGSVDGQIIYDNYVSKDAADYAMEFVDGKDKSTIIFDTKNYAMLILADSDGERTGFATSIDPEAMAELAEDYAEENEEEIDIDSYRPVKTGKTKEILGYSCDEYLIEDEESEIHMWVSEKLGKDIRKEWMNNQQTFGSMFTHAYALNGMVLEYDLIEKNGEKTIMLVTEIDMNHSHSVNTSGYTIMSMRQKTEEEKQ
jgi:hypothetical protein